MTSAKGGGSSRKNQQGNGSEHRNAGALGDSETAAAAQTRMQQTQQQVDEVVTIMRSNVEKVMERDRYLSDLDQRADALHAGAAEFERRAVTLKRKYWWKNLRMMIILGVVIFLVVTGLAFWISSYMGGGGNSDHKEANNTASMNSTALHGTNGNITGGTVVQLVVLTSNGTQFNLAPQ